jgi:hypothetical protein
MAESTGRLILDTIVLSFEVAGDALSDEYVAKILSLPEVQRKLQEELTKLAQARFEMDNGLKPQTSQGQVAADVLEDAAAKIAPKALEVLKTSPDYKALMRTLKELHDHVKKTAVGAWFDKHVGVLYLVAAGVALGGAATLYVLQTGDKPMKYALSLLDGTQLYESKCGTLTLNLGKVNFVPSQHLVQLSTFMTKDWEGAKGSLSLVGKAVGDHFTVGAGAQLVIPVKKVPFTLSAAGAGGTDSEWALSLGVGFKAGAVQFDVLGHLASDKAVKDVALGAYQAPKGIGRAPIGTFGDTAGLNAGLTYKPTKDVSLGVTGGVGTLEDGRKVGGVLGTLTITLGKK